MRALEQSVDATDGAARATTITTDRGSFPTPCFMPVGTRGAVRTLAAADLEALGAPVVLANTYHLMLRPGADVVEGLGGIHGMAAWPGHVLTDSGGYQVFSLGPKVDDDGVTFRSTYDGSTHRMTPETCTELQLRLGADIAMVLDVCPPLPALPGVVELAVARTAAWAARARAEHLRLGGGAPPAGPSGLRQAQFGIVQGGIDPVLRGVSARQTIEHDFDGHGIGGLSVGETRAEMLPALAATLDVLPAGRPRYLMGVGDPAGLVEAVGLGVDLFDCVLPTRLGRHGTVLTSTGRHQARRASWARDEGPIDASCPCLVCARHSRAYLRHLLVVDEPTAPRLLTIHNLTYLLGLVAAMRTAVLEGRFAALRAEVLALWG